ncbi:MAG TPA: hypothetical protein DD429_07750 [Clostridiaceae bacterium]|jgi:O-antigen ligase|nr:hypothetical protein [Clostridiaceae bacterium]
MFVEMTGLSNRKKITFIFGFIILGILCSLFAAGDYQGGLEKVFWVCVLTAMVGYLIRNVMIVDKLFYLFIFTIPFMNMLSFSYKYILPVGVCFFIFLSTLILRRKITVDGILHTKNGRLLFLYVIVNFMVFPYSINMRTSALYNITFPIVILIWDWAVEYSNSKNRIEGVLKAFNFVGLFFSIMGIIVMILNYNGFQLPQHLSYDKIYDYYMNSVFPNTNTHGMLLTFTIPCALYFFLESKDRRQKGLYFISLLIMGANLFLTFSRSSWGAVAIAGTIILLYKYRKMKYIFIILCISVVLMFQSFLGVHIGSGKFSSGLFGLSSRGILWGTAAKAIADRPITGFGIGNSVDVLDSYSSIIMDRTPHNTFLRMWLELGIFGLLIYIAFLYNIIHGFFKFKGKHMMLVTVFAILMGSIFQQMFETMLLGGLSIIGGYFFVFSALFESMISRPMAGSAENENMLSC